jgi:hypothetical protein
MLPVSVSNQQTGKLPPMPLPRRYPGTEAPAAIQSSEAAIISMQPEASSTRVMWNGAGTHCAENLPGDFSEHGRRHIEPETNHEEKGPFDNQRGEQRARGGRRT